MKKKFLAGLAAGVVFLSLTCLAHGVTCDDYNPCTTDIYVEGTGCTYTPVNCDDGNPCTVDNCTYSTGCYHQTNACDDSNPCTDDICDPVTGCASTPVNCDDGNPCTNDICDAGLGCLNTPVPVDTPCPDVAFCNGFGACDETGTCVGQSTDCPILTSCVGFDPPLDQSPVMVKKHRALPLKANLFDGDGFEITDVEIVSPPVILILYSLDNTTPPIDVTDLALSPGMSTSGNQFEYTGSKWQFNLSTKDYTAPGKYDINIQSGNLAEYEVETCSVSFVVE